MQRIAHHVVLSRNTTRFNPLLCIAQRALSHGSSGHTEHPIAHSNTHNAHHSEHRQQRGGDPYSVLIYGDSNTWGFDPDCSLRAPTQRFAHKDRWTTLCQEMLGGGFRLIPEGLSGRTTIFSDHAPPPCDGEYDCNGRNTLAATLHSHKPLDVVVLALGANDLKSKFRASPHDVVAGVRILIRDVQRMSNLGTYPHTQTQDAQGRACSTHTQHLQAPHILVLSPPVLKSTPLNRLWGFEEHIETKSRKLLGLLSVVCKELRVSFLNLGSVAHVSHIDGVHFPASEQHKIATAVAHKLLEIAQHRH